MKVLKFLTASIPYFPAGLVFIWCRRINIASKRHDGREKSPISTFFELEDAALFETWLKFNLLDEPYAYSANEKRL